MDLHQVRLALLKISLVVIAGVGWLFSALVLETRPEVEADADPLTSLVRLPASLPAQIPGAIPGVFTPPVKAPDPVRMETVKLPCWDATGRPALGTGARWVRLVGHACQSDARAESITIRNLTNGYMATIFASKQSDLTTDYIPLESGNNEILFRFDAGPDVHLENRITFVR